MSVEESTLSALERTWWVYMVRAENGHLYTGISVDPERRFVQHQSGKGARFFNRSPAAALVWRRSCLDHGDALRQERAIKALTRKAKECLINQPDGDLSVCPKGQPASVWAVYSGGSFRRRAVMTDLILHHYPQSPFAEKARLLLGFKGLSWHSVMIPPVMPKPDLTALTGGYRRTPVLQVGADIYCDTALIARRLEQEKSAPALFPEGQEAAAASLAQFADQVLFQHAVAINFQPKGLAERFAGMPEQVIKGFVADRQKLFSGGTASRLDTDVALGQWPALLSRLETQLERDGDFLLGSQPSIADFSHYHALWFVASNRAVADALEPYPAVRAWMQRVRDIGHGSHAELSADEAIRIAREATPAALPTDAISSPTGLAAGQAVIVNAVDYGTDEVAGTLLYEGAEEIIIAREDERAGLVHVHFPRFGFRIRAA